MSELLRDVDEMMRQERLMALWKTYGNVIIGAILVLLLGIGLYKARAAYVTHKAVQATAALQAASEGGEPVKALTAYAQSTGGNPAALARMLAAGKALDAGDKEGAGALYKALREDGAVAPELRGLATLAFVRIKSNDAATKPEDLLALLVPLMAEAKGPWAGLARIEAAALQANRLGNFAAAVKLLEPMAADPSVPLTQSERVNALLHVYQTRQIQGEKK